MSYREIEELITIRGVKVDHATIIHRGVNKFSSQLEASFRRRKHNVGKRWRMDETYVKVKGEWRYLYRAVDKEVIRLTSIDQEETANVRPIFFD